MISLHRMQDMPRTNALNVLVSMCISILLAAAVFGHTAADVNAAAGTVTLRYGSDIEYGSGRAGHTKIKWVTHIDGESIDLDDVAGVSRSYAYCVQPFADSPPEGTHSVTLVDDDGSGKVAKMRKMIYYLPGAYGYTKVSKNRWFPNGNTTDDYIIGHLALSWIYDGYSDAYSVWGDAPSSMVSKTKSIVNDLDNLAEPPEDFEIFWVRVSGLQDVFGAFYKAEFGKAEMQKTSANTGITNANGAYSLAGAKYTLYEDASCKSVAKTKDGADAVLTTNESGNSNVIEVETGKYFAKETLAPKGYARDDKVYTIEVIKDKTTKFSSREIPITDRIDLLLSKVDNDTKRGEPQGDAGISGAVYRFTYYDGSYQSVSAAESSGRAKANWYFATDGSGAVSGSNPQKAEGYESSELYRDIEGKIAFPLGTYVIQEVKAPTGYLINNAKLLVRVTEDGTDKAYVKTYNEKTTSADAVIRGGVKLAKIDNDLSEAYSQGDATLAGAEFTVYNKSARSVYVSGKEQDKDAVALVIRTDERGIATSTADALPYGTYIIKETKPSKGYLLNSKWSRTFTIRENGKVIDLTENKVREAVERGGVQIVKRDKELAKSEAMGGASLSDIEFTVRNASKHDVVVRSGIGSTDVAVDWKKLESKKELFDSEKVMRVKPGEDICKIVTHWNEEKNAYTAETLADDLPYGTYTIRETRTNASYQRTDKSEHIFEIREDGIVAAFNDGKDESALTFDDYVYRSDLQGTKIGDGDSRRFSYVPFKITSVSNGETHVVVTDNNGLFSTKDRRTADELDEEEGAETARKVNPFDDLLGAKEIKKSDLQKRSSEMRMGVWFGTGVFGSKAGMNAKFGSLPYDSYVIEELHCDENDGYDMQKFFFTVDAKSQNGFVDLETITDDIPEIGTSASVDGKNTDVSPAKEITLTDTIEYSGLKRLTKYIAKGRLIDKSTGEVMKDAAGREITAEKEFTTVLSRGKVRVVFTFDGSNMYGADTVVFETVYDADGHVIARHEDINDREQTVRWKEHEKPSIGTTLTGEGNAKEVIESDETLLTDEIAYTGLDTDAWYVFEGTLMVKDTGDPLVEHGTKVSAASEPFKPSEPDGKHKVVFKVNTKGLAGRELVAFETAYSLEGYSKDGDISKAKLTKIAEHKDINDKEQTVKVKEPGSPHGRGTPETGDSDRRTILYSILIAAAAEGLLLTLKRRNDRLN